MTKEKRIEELLKMSDADLVAHAEKLGFRNIQFKKMFEDSSNNVPRPKQDIASMIYYKENGR